MSADATHTRYTICHFGSLDYAIPVEQVPTFCEEAEDLGPEHDLYQTDAETNAIKRFVRKYRAFLIDLPTLTFCCPESEKSNAAPRGVVARKNRKARP